MTGTVTVPSPPLDLSATQRLHVVGVGGPGMSAIGIVLAEMGHQVSGSDIRERSVLDRVRTAGVVVNVGHDRAVVHGADAVTASSAIPATNVEIDEARATGVTVLRRAGMLASICAMAKSVAVAGTHGKTTTTSMLMRILAEAGLRPNFIIGGDVADIGTGAQWTGGEWLVVEADESDGTHLELPLHGTILTNVEADHLDHFGTAEAIVDSFRRYLAQIPGPKILCADDPVCRTLAGELGRDDHVSNDVSNDVINDVITYGIAGAPDMTPDMTPGMTPDVIADQIEAGHGEMRFRVRTRQGVLGHVRLPLRGRHNVLNATAALTMAGAIGVPFDVAAAALGKFGGVARRFDIRGHAGGATLVDDYAHLPTEIAVVMAAASTSGDGWTRRIAVFQPNRYNRMSELSPEYADAFVDADVVVITEIYASGTTPIPGVTGKLVVNAVTEAHPRARVVWLPHRSDLVDFVAAELRPGDVCVSMGCGDIESFPDEVVRRFHELRGGAPLGALRHESAAV